MLLKEILIIALLCTSMLQGEERHVFILSGQSNMAKMDEIKGFLTEAKPFHNSSSTRRAGPVKISILSLS